MENKYENVKVKRIFRNPDSLDFEIQVEKSRKIRLLNCQATHDFSMVDNPFISLHGSYELHDSEIHYSKGTLHVYGKPFNTFQRCDLLLNE